MDFSIIDELTDEELNELYNDNVIKDPDTAYAGGCVCCTRSGGTVVFGVHLFNEHSFCCGNEGDCG